MISARYDFLNKLSPLTENGAAYTVYWSRKGSKDMIVSGVGFMIKNTKLEEV